MSIIAKETISSGGFIFYKDSRDNEIYVLLIENLKSEYWIPKGKIEAGEDQKTTAFREIKEEVGFGPEKIKYVGFCRLDKYIYDAEGIAVLKQLYINIFEALEKYSPLPEDWKNIKQVGWYTYKDAVGLISFNKEDLINSYTFFKSYKQIA